MSLRVNKTPAALGLTLTAAALLWHFGLAERWTQRIPPGWSVTSRYTGTLTFPDPMTKRLPDHDELGEYERSMRAISEAGRPRSVQIEDRYTVRDVRAHKVVFEYVTTASVDPRTGAHVAPEHAGEIVLFPRDVAKGTYVLRSNYVKGVPLAFERIDEVDGLETYVFSYRGRGEYSEEYAGSAEYEGVKLEPGQEIRCADDQFYYRTWVEPVTGMLVRLEEGCTSGDYVFDNATGEAVAAVARWTGVTTGNDLLRTAAEVRELRFRYLLATRYAPLALLCGGVILFGLGLNPSARGSVA